MHRRVCNPELISRLPPAQALHRHITTKHTAWRVRYSSHRPPMCLRTGVPEVRRECAQVRESHVPGRRPSRDRSHGQWRPEPADQRLERSPGRCHAQQTPCDQLRGGSVFYRGVPYAQVSLGTIMLGSRWKRKTQVSLMKADSAKQQVQWAERLRKEIQEKQAVVRTSPQRAPNVFAVDCTAVAE